MEIAFLFTEDLELLLTILMAGVVLPAAIAVFTTNLMTGVIRLQRMVEIVPFCCNTSDFHKYINVITINITNVTITSGPQVDITTNCFSIKSITKVRIINNVSSTHVFSTNNAPIETNRKHKGTLRGATAVAAKESAR